MEATHKISACYYPATQEVDLTWEEIKGEAAHLSVKVSKEEGESIASVVMPCVYIGTVTKERHLLEEVLHQCHNEGNGEYTLPAWFITEIRQLIS
jgi:hypothetical protein